MDELESTPSNCSGLTSYQKTDQENSVTDNRSLNNVTSNIDQIAGLNGHKKENQSKSDDNIENKDIIVQGYPSFGRNVSVGAATKIKDTSEFSNVNDYGNSTVAEEGFAGRVNERDENAVSVTDKMIRSSSTDSGTSQNLTKGVTVTDTIIANENSVTSHSAIQEDTVIDQSTIIDMNVSNEQTVILIDQNVTNEDVVRNQNVTNEDTVIDKILTNADNGTDHNVTNENTVTDEKANNADIVKDQNVTDEEAVLDQNVANEDTVIDQNVTNEETVIDHNVTNEDKIIEHNATNEDMVTDQKETNEDIVIDQKVCNEDVVIYQNITNEDAVIDQNVTNEDTVIDQNVTNEGTVLDQNVINEDTIIDQNTVLDGNVTNEDTVIDQNVSNEDTVIDQNVTNEDTIIDQNVTNEDMVTDQKETNEDIVIDQKVCNEDVAIDQNITNENAVIDQNVTNEDTIIDQNVINEDTVIDQNVTNEDTVIDQNVAIEDMVIDQNVTNEDTIIDQNVTNEDMGTDQNETNKDIVIDQKVSNEDVVINQNVTNEDAVIDQNVTNEDAVMGQNVTNEDAVIDQNVTNEDAVIDQNVTNEDAVIDQNVTNEDAVIDQNVTNKGTVLDQNVINEDTVIDQNTVLGQNVANEDTVIDQNLANEVTVINQNVTNEDMVTNQNETIKDIVIYQNVSNEDVVIDQNETNEDAVMDQNVTNEDTVTTTEYTVKDQNVTNEDSVTYTILTNEDAVTDQKVTNVNNVTDQNVTNEDAVIDQNVTNEGTVLDQNVINEDTVIDQNTVLDQNVMEVRNEETVTDQKVTNEDTVSDQKVTNDDTVTDENVTNVDTVTDQIVTNDYTVVIREQKVINEDTVSDQNVTHEDMVILVLDQNVTNEDSVTELKVVNEDTVTVQNVRNDSVTDQTVTNVDIIAEHQYPRLPESTEEFDDIFRENVESSNTVNNKTSRSSKSDELEDKDVINLVEEELSSDVIYLSAEESTDVCKDTANTDDIVSELDIDKPHVRKKIHTDLDSVGIIRSLLEDAIVVNSSEKMKGDSVINAKDVTIIDAQDEANSVDNFESIDSLQQPVWNSDDLCSSQIGNPKKDGNYINADFGEKNTVVKDQIEIVSSRSEAENCAILDNQSKTCNDNEIKEGPKIITIEPESLTSPTLIVQQNPTIDSPLQTINMTPLILSTEAKSTQALNSAYSDMTTDTGSSVIDFLSLPNNFKKSRVYAIAEYKDASRTAIKSFGCNFCMFTCTSFHAIKQHEQMHIFSCSECDFATRYRSSLCKHVLTCCPGLYKGNSCWKSALVQTQSLREVSKQHELNPLLSKQHSQNRLERSPSIVQNTDVRLENSAQDNNSASQQYPVTRQTSSNGEECNKYQKSSLMSAQISYTNYMNQFSNEIQLQTITRNNDIISRNVLSPHTNMNVPGLQIQAAAFNIPATQPTLDYSTPPVVNVAQITSANSVVKHLKRTPTSQFSPQMEQSKQSGKNGAEMINLYIRANYSENLKTWFNCVICLEPTSFFSEAQTVLHLLTKHNICLSKSINPDEFPIASLLPGDLQQQVQQQVTGSSSAVAEITGTTLSTLSAAVSEQSVDLYKMILANLQKNRENEKSQAESISWQCFYCSWKDATKQSVVKHIVENHPKQLIKLKRIVKVRPKSSLDDTMHNVDEQTVWNCFYCSVEEDSRVKIITHVKTVHPNCKIMITRKSQVKPADSLQEKEEDAFTHWLLKALMDNVDGLCWVWKDCLIFELNLAVPIVVDDEKPNVFREWAKSMNLGNIASYLEYLRSKIFLLKFIEMAVNERSWLLHVGSLKGADGSEGYRYYRFNFKNREELKKWMPNIKNYNLSSKLESVVPWLYRMLHTEDSQVYNLQWLKNETNTFRIACKTGTGGNMQQLCTKWVNSIYKLTFSANTHFYQVTEIILLHAVARAVIQGKLIPIANHNDSFAVYSFSNTLNFDQMLKEDSEEAVIISDEETNWDKFKVDPISEATPVGLFTNVASAAIPTTVDNTSILDIDDTLNSNVLNQASFPILPSSQVLNTLDEVQSIDPSIMLSEQLAEVNALWTGDGYGFMEGQPKPGRKRRGEGIDGVSSAKRLAYSSNTINKLQASLGSPTFTQAGNISTKNMDHSFKIYTLAEMPDDLKIDLRIYMDFNQKTKIGKCRECNYISEGVHAQSHLREHVMLHSGGKSWSCAYCGYMCNRKGSLFVHTLIQHPREPKVVIKRKPDTKFPVWPGLKNQEEASQFWQCPYCSRRSPSHVTMQQHLMFVHATRNQDAELQRWTRVSLPHDLLIKRHLKTAIVKLYSLEEMQNIPLLNEVLDNNGVDLTKPDSENLNTETETEKSTQRVAEFKCWNCSEYFYTLEKYFRHVLNEHRHVLDFTPEFKFSCNSNMCKFVSISMKMMVVHFQTEHSQDKNQLVKMIYTSDDTAKPFVVARNNENRVNYIFGIPLKCPVSCCKFEAIKEKLVERHLKDIHQIIFKIESIGSILENLKIQTEERPLSFQCHYCPYTTKLIENVKDHEKYAHKYSVSKALEFNSEGIAVKFLCYVSNCSFRCESEEDLHDHYQEHISLNIMGSDSSLKTADKIHIRNLLKELREKFNAKSTTSKQEQGDKRKHTSLEDATSQISFKCHYCPYTTNLIEKVKIHVKHVHKNCVSKTCESNNEGMALKFLCYVSNCHFRSKTKEELHNHYQEHISLNIPGSGSKIKTADEIHISNLLKEKFNDESTTIKNEEGCKRKKALSDDEEDLDYQPKILSLPKIPRMKPTSQGEKIAPATNYDLINTPANPACEVQIATTLEDGGVVLVDTVRLPLVDEGCDKTSGLPRILGVNSEPVKVIDCEGRFQCSYCGKRYTDLTEAKVHAIYNHFEKYKNANFVTYNDNYARWLKKKYRILLCTNLKCVFFCKVLELMQSHEQCSSDINRVFDYQLSQHHCILNETYKVPRPKILNIKAQSTGSQRSKRSHVKPPTTRNRLEPKTARNRLEPVTARSCVEQTTALIRVEPTTAPVADHIADCGVIDISDGENENDVKQESILSEEEEVYSSNVQDTSVLHEMVSSSNTGENKDDDDENQEFIMYQCDSCMFQSSDIENATKHLKERHVLGNHSSGFTAMVMEYTKDGDVTMKAKRGSILLPGKNQ